MKTVRCLPGGRETEVKPGESPFGAAIRLFGKVSVSTGECISFVKNEFGDEYWTLRLTFVEDPVDWRA